MDDNIRQEEYYEKLRAILRVADIGGIDGQDRDALIWVARDYLEKLGEVMGIVGKK